jgi:queuine tRNA-ribosyltransferase
MFMPIGTKAAVKAVGPDDLRNLGAKIVLANTYHLLLRPGVQIIETLGGLHSFMSWDGPILTDSGGYQIFSLSGLRTLSEDGVTFRSTYDGSKVFLSPEEAVEVQQRFGVDIMMCLDECTTFPATRQQAQKSLDLTYRWAARARKAWSGSGALFGIAQGGIYPDLRLQAAKQIRDLDFPGQAVGGLALGESAQERHAAIEAAREGLDPNKPMYLMGLGTPSDILEGIKRGADLFDCVMPTRNARNGQLFTSFGKVNILNSRYKTDADPIDQRCQCLTCRNFSRSYLRHLHQNREPLYLRLASIHNLHYYIGLVEGARLSLINGTFSCYYDEFYDFQNQGV